MEQRKNGRGIFYGVIGVATLVVAIIGATFAYFTASASNNNVITGDMATVKLALSVRQVKADEGVVEDTAGIIPMSNGMVQPAVEGNGGLACKDDNGNAVCQIYEITLDNSSSAGQFVDGYVSLKGGSGEPKDYTTYKNGAKFLDGVANDTNGKGTTMRWAQVFLTKTDTTPDALEEEKVYTYAYSTTGVQELGTAKGEDGKLTDEAKATFGTALGGTTSKHSIEDIKTDYALTSASGVKGVLADKKLIGGDNQYKVINTNYIRVSDHAWNAAGNESYKRENDVTSALVFSHNVAAHSAAKYYIVVWLSETGTNQTAGASGVNVPDTGLSFFSGNVTFVSAQGSEVSATFSNYTRVPSQATQPQQ